MDESLTKQFMVVNRINFWIVLCYCFSFFVSVQQMNAQMMARISFDPAKNSIINTKNDKNWARFATQVKRNKSINKSNLTIVHIGDSHIQGGYYTNRFRELLDQSYGIKERGFIFPYSLLKANGSEDVKFFSTSGWTGEKYNHSLSRQKAGISGYNLHLKDSTGMISISRALGAGPYFSFHELVVYHNDSFLQVSSESATRVVTNATNSQLFASHMFFATPIDSITIHFQNCHANTLFFGFDLKNSQPGITYDAIGVNGASFETFANDLDYISELKVMVPDCIIISLGTNDSYLRELDTLILKHKIISMIEKIRKEFPASCIILTTPGDHLLHKKYFNDNLIKASATIISAASDQHCAYWDFFNVMGGLGSSKKWAQNGLMYRDMLHLSKEGYKLQGDLFFEAFTKAIEESSTINQ